MCRKNPSCIVRDGWTAEHTEDCETKDEHFAKHPFDPKNQFERLDEKTCETCAKLINEEMSLTSKILNGKRVFNHKTCRYDTIIEIDHVFLMNLTPETQLEFGPIIRRVLKEQMAKAQEVIDAIHTHDEILA
jgi:hypothetical protein